MASSIAVDQGHTVRAALWGTGILLGGAAAVTLLMWVGYLLALALTVGILASPILVLFVGLATGLHRRLRGSSLQNLDTPTEAGAAKSVTVRITEAEGVCVLGLRFRAGQVLSLDNIDGQQDLCPFPCSRLQSWLDTGIVADALSSSRLVCEDADHRIVFMLEGRRTKAATGPAAAGG